MIHAMHRDDVPPHPGPEDDAPRRPPASLEAEQALLGSLLLDNGALSLVGDLIEPASFFAQQHQWIYAAIVALLGQRQPADVTTVHDALAAAGHGAADGYGGMAYLIGLEAGVPNARNARRYAEIVAERWHERQLIAGCDEISSLSWQQHVPLSDRLERIAGVLARVEQQRQGPGRRVPVLRLDALRESAERVRWAVKHVIPSASIGMLFGGSGTFKSFIALDLALHVAHGLPWMGRRTVQGQVLYIAAEGGAGLWGRVDAWHRERSLAWQRTPLYVVPQAVDLTVDAWRVVEAAQAVGAQPALVVVDTLSQTYSGEENSANEMAAYLREIGLRFRALWECAVLLIHHSGHEATERPRGSSAIRANVDFLLGAYRDQKEMIATVSCVKQKDGELFADAQFRLSPVRLGYDEDNDPITSLVARHLSTADQIERARAEEAAAGRSGHKAAFLAMLDDCTEERSLRRAVYEMLGAASDESKKRTWFRLRKWALDEGLIDIVDGRVIDRRKVS